MSRIVLALLVFASYLWGQSFEVASIRLHATPVQRIGASVSGQRFAAEAMSLDNLITYAYEVKRYQLLGVPSWADSNDPNCLRYDVIAKAEGDQALSRNQARTMLQNLLADRFGLRFHREVKEMPVYALVVAKNGPKIKDTASAAPGSLIMAGRNDIELTSNAGSIAQLVNQLANANGVDRPVLDRTDLRGNYDYKLTWTPTINTGNDSEAISIFTALQEQLGLRLDPQRAPIEVLIIDQAEKPSNN
jgi:uncharacterized protein (TIGR03435 family)